MIVSGYYSNKEICKTIIIYGVGRFGRIYYLLNRRKYDVMCFAVSSMENNPQEYLCVPVKEIEGLLEYKDTVQIVVAVNKANRNEIIKKLKNLEFKNIDTWDMDEYPNCIYDLFANAKESEYETMLSDWYEYVMNKKVDLNNPRTFNEKIQWLKLHDSTPLKTKLADKYSVREWVAEKIGEEYLIPLVGGPWESVDGIDFGSLPDKCVFKATHGSDMNYIYEKKDKINYNEIKAKMDKWLETDFGIFGCELHYFDIPKKIIAEEYLQQSDGDLVDYKIYCFNGKPQFVQVIGQRDLKSHSARLALYDLEWKRLEFTTGDYEEYDYLLERPNNFPKMINIAQILSSDFKYVRVDLYNIDGKIYFGEMTFTPGNGILPWNKEWADEYVGKFLELN